MKQTWIEALRDHISGAWAVLTGRAYAAYSVPDIMDEVRLRAALCEIEEIAYDEADITNNGGPNAAMRIQAIARNALDGVTEP